MGESANLAFYAVVFAKGTVPRARLDEALTKAVGGGAPLETVLVQTGALGRADCDELLRVRERLGRPCQACDGVTYLLQDQTEANTPCEYCGGRLLTREQQRARDAARAAQQAAPAAQATRRPPPPVRGRPSEATPPVGIRKGPPPPPREPAAGALEARLGALERQVAALAREVAEEREARAQMSALVNEAAARSAQGLELAARLEGLAAAAGERAVALLHERLGVDDLSRLPGRIAEQVAPRVLDAVRDRLGLDELADLPARVAAEALAAAAARGGGGAPVDEEALAARVAEQVRAALPPAPDVEGPLARLAERVAALEGVAPAEAAAPAPVDEAALVERVLEAVAARLPGVDPEALAERVTRRALEAVSDRLERLDPHEGQERALERAAEATRALVEASAREQAAAARDLVRSLEERLAALATPAAAPEGLAADVAREVEGALAARLEERVAEQSAAIEERLARATTEVLEALNARVDEVASDAARAGEVASTVVREALERLDDPRELLARAVAQATQAFEARLADALGEARAAAAPAPEPAASGLADRLDAVADELREGLERLDARVAALRERAANRPQEDARALIGALEARLAALEARPEADADVAARVAALEARPAAASAEDGAGADDEATARGVVQRAVQAVWDQLAPLDLPGLPGRVTEQVTASITARLDREMAGLVDTIAQEATAPVLKSIESRLERLDLKGLPARVTREVSGQVRAALGDDEALAEALAERVARLLPAPGGGEATAAGASPANVEELVDRAAARALEWVEDRLTALERGGGVEVEIARAVAKAAAAQVVDERLRDLRPTPADFDGAKTVTVDPSKSGVVTAGESRSEPKTGVFDKKFVALAREVKGLKEAVEALQEGGGGARPAGASTEVVGLLASPEFKQTFDAKVKEVLNYVKTDLVPSAVKRALQQGSEAR